MKIQTRRKVIKSSIHNLYRFRILAKKEQPCQNNLEKSSTERKVKHDPSGYSWGLICLFDKTKTGIISIEENILLKRFVKI